MATSLERNRRVDKTESYARTRSDTEAHKKVREEDGAFTGG